VGRNWRTPEGGAAKPCNTEMKANDLAQSEHRLLIQHDDISCACPAVGNIASQSFRMTAPRPRWKR